MNYRTAVGAAVLLIAAVSCRSSQPIVPVETVQAPAEPAKINEPAAAMEPEQAAPEPLPVEEPAEEKAEPISETKTVASVPFDPKTITKEVFDSTKTDVQELIVRLNAIIRAKDYERWVTFLGKDYRAGLSDPSFLQRISNSTILRKQRITLRELRDYFIYVVVPSRANDHVDDIEFIGQNRVKAFTMDSKGRRLRLYDLEKTPTGWEIVN